MAIGVVIAAQLLWPDLISGIPFLSYGRLRPLHTNAVIFAFGGCALFATSYYVVQRTSRARLGTACLVTSTRNPLYLALEWATLDVISGGRTILGACKGNPEEGVRREFAGKTAYAAGFRPEP